MFEHKLEYNECQPALKAVSNKLSNSGVATGNSLRSQKSQGILN